MTDTYVDDVEPCAWIVGPDRWRRPCNHPSVVLVASAAFIARVCAKHRDVAVAAGWKAIGEPEVEP